MKALVDAARYGQIQQFLYREARLLDSRDYDGWLQMLAPDIRYWAPNRSNRLVVARTGDRDIAKELSQLDEAAIYDESFGDLQLRISRMTTAHKLWCENPPSRVRHIISNIEAYERSSTESEFDVFSNFVVHQSRFDEKGVSFFGARNDIIVLDDSDELKIRRRTIILDVTVIPTGAITIFF